jgi:tetratricopeptide (TPR) repeat protein
MRKFGLFFIGFFCWNIAACAESKLSILKDLHKQKREGAITVEEFEQKKNALFAKPVTEPVLATQKKDFTKGTKDPFEINSRGIELFNKGQIKKAMPCFKETIELAPDFASAHYYLGKSLWLLNDKAAAKACFQKAMAIAPNLFDGTEPFAKNKKDILFALGQPQLMKDNELRYINANGEVTFTIGDKDVKAQSNSTIDYDEDIDKVIDMDHMLRFPEGFIDRAFNIKVRVLSVKNLNGLYLLDLKDMQTKKYVFTSNLLFVVHPDRLRHFLRVIDGSTQNVYLRGTLKKLDSVYAFYATEYSPFF